MTQDLSFYTRRDGLIDHRDAYWNNSVGWDPIGGEFTATLDGNGYAIDLLYSKPASGLAGLFDTIGADGRVRNLGLTNVNVEASGSVLAAGSLHDEGQRRQRQRTGGHHSVTSSSRDIDADGVVWNFTSGKQTY